MLKSQIIEQLPDFPWLNVEKPREIAVFLRRLGCLKNGEPVTGCEVAGAGNMNLTVRVSTPFETFIVKQSRPWVEKYDHIAAPWDRILAELAFYQRVSAMPPLTSQMPRLLGSDPAARVIVLEDLGKAGDFTDIYSGARIGGAEIDSLAGFLRALHDSTEGSFHPDFANRQMRELNHEHIYVFPLARGNGLSLDRFEPGFGLVSDQLKADHAYLQKVAETGRRYLADGSCLLHGDFFPGSWLRTSEGPRVIDPEFCYYGDREFDVACAAAHLVIADDVPAMRRFVASYGPERLDLPLVARYAAAETMRRLIGVAQLPLPPSTGRRSLLLQRSHRAMISEALEDL